MSAVLCNFLYVKKGAVKLNRNWLNSAFDVSFSFSASLDAFFLRRLPGRILFFADHEGIIPFSLLNHRCKAIRLLRRLFLAVWIGDQQFPVLRDAAKDDVMSVFRKISFTDVFNNRIALSQRVLNRPRVHLAPAPLDPILIQQQPQRVSPQSVAAIQPELPPPSA